MTTAKITQCTFTNSSQTKFGLYHYHRITFENGDVGNVGSTTKNSPKFAEGQTVTYEITDGKLKIVSAPPPPLPPPSTFKASPPKGYTKKPDEFIGYVIGYAKDVVCAKITAKHKIEDESAEVCKVADELYAQVKRMLANNEM